MKVKLFLSFIILVLVSSCASPKKTLVDFPLQIMLTITDLPEGFDFSYNDFEQINDGIEYEIQYAKTDKSTGSGVTHSVVVFENDKKASEYYVSIDNQFSSQSTYYVPVDFEFLPKEKSDLFRIGCWDVTLNSYPTISCRFIQLHNNLVIEARTNVNEKNISMQEFNFILKNLDSRLPDETVNMPSIK